MDEILQGKMIAFLTKSIESYHNWTVLLMALIYRSSIEFKDKKKQERAMNQFEEIVNDWNSMNCSLYERSKYLFFLGFPYYLKIIKILADSYVSINCLNTAYSLLVDYKLYKEGL